MVWIIHGSSSNASFSRAIMTYLLHRKKMIKKKDRPEVRVWISRHQFSRQKENGNKRAPWVATWYIFSPSPRSNWQLSLKIPRKANDTFTLSDLPFLSLICPLLPSHPFSIRIRKRKKNMHQRHRERERMKIRRRLINAVTSARIISAIKICHSCQGGFSRRKRDRRRIWRK